MNRNCVLALALTGLSTVATAATQVGGATGDLIVVLKTEEFILGGTRTYDFQSIGRGLGSRVINSLAGGRILVVRPPKGRDWRTYRKELLSSGVYESVEPDTVAAPTALSNDPSLTQQQHLFQISAPRAWDFSDGSTAPILAVVDGGVEINHPDLVDNLVPGYNTISGLTQGAGGLVSDVTTNSHGTRIAGIAAARGNNGVGVSGVGWNLRLMPVRATDQANGTTARSELLEGATWAIQNGAKVVNVSYTEVQFSDVETLGAWARTQGALVVWSAGNTETNWANFDHDNVTVVGGVDGNDQRWDVNTSTVSTGSGFGKGVDCFAPVTGVYTTRKGSPAYGLAPAGVSFAVPQVAATLALMMGREPTLSPTEIERRMLLRCANMGPLGNDINFGYGRLNAGAAVEWPIRKYSLTRIAPNSVGGVPNAIGIRARGLSDDGTVYAGITRNGQSPVLARWRDGVWIEYISSDQLRPDASGLEVTVEDVNAAGHAAGSVWTGSQYFGFVWRPGVGVFQAPFFGFNRTFLNGINNVGEAVGFAYNAFSFTNGYYMNSDGVFSQPISQPPYNMSGNHKYCAISEEGTIIGVLGTQPFTFSQANGIEYAQAVGFQYGDIAEATEEGAFIAQFSGPNNFTPNAYLYDAKRRVSQSFGSYKAPYGLNESEEVVGAETDANGDSLQAIILRGFVTGRLIDHLAPLVDDPNNVLPQGITGLIESTEINNLGQILVRATSNMGEAALLANPVDTPGLGMSLGQLGANPTYIGSIPPALSVTYCNDAGVPYPNGTVTNDYRGDVGLMNISPPASVTGSYRVYLRCNSTAIPGYEGPKFLSRMIPPLNLPPAPRDSFYLPYAGATTSTGIQQPVIELYPGDVDESGEIDAADIDIVIANFGSVLGGPVWDGGSDVDGSGEIDAVDIDVVIANFGLTDDPEP